MALPKYWLITVQPDTEGPGYVAICTNRSNGCSIGRAYGETPKEAEDHLIEYMERQVES